MEVDLLRMEEWGGALDGPLVGNLYAAGIKGGCWARQDDSSSDEHERGVFLGNRLRANYGSVGFCAHFARVSI